MTTKKALRKKIAALEEELEKTKKELEKARYSANTSHLYREHCVQNWLASDKEVERLEIENAKLRAENRRIIAGLHSVKATVVTRDNYYEAKEVN